MSYFFITMSSIFNTARVDLIVGIRKHYWVDNRQEFIGNMPGVHIWVYINNRITRQTFLSMTLLFTTGPLFMTTYTNEALTSIDQYIIAIHHSKAILTNLNPFAFG